MANFANKREKITYFAETDYRSRRIKFGIKDDDRARHMYIIGKTGMGKSTLLENLAIQDIQNGEGLCFIDPHGGTAETLLSYVPEHRVRDVIYFAPFDLDYPIALNVMEDIGADKRSLVASGLIGAFKKVWVDAWSPRMEYLLNNALLALLEYPGSTLLGVNRIFADKNYRALIVSNVSDPSVKAFWLDEYAKYSDKFATEATAAIQNKVGQFAANPLIRNIVGQPKSTFDIRRVMDERKILIVNLSKGRLGEGNANLIGSMLITKIYLAAMSRADVGPEAVQSLPPFYLYVDEFQSFANESFADILSEARKYRLSLTIAHQYIEQMSEEVRAAVFGNVGTMISFRVGAYDAEVLEREFAPVFTAEDMVNLGFAQIYLKLMINGVGSHPFSATTLPRPPAPAHNFAAEVIRASREQFARPRAVVEEEIRKWHEPVPEPPRDPNAPPETKRYPSGMRPERRGTAPTNAAGHEISDRHHPERRPAPVEYVPVMSNFPVMGDHPLSTMDAPLSPQNVLRKHAGEVARDDGTTPVNASHQPFAVEFAKILKDSTPGPARESPSVSRELSEEYARQPTSLKYTGPNHKQEEGKNAGVMPIGARKGVVQPKKEQTASLTALKTEQKKDKGPSAERLQSLREALLAAGVRTQEEGLLPTEQKETTVSSPLSTTAKASLLEPSTSENTKREIPEDVLKSVLSD